MLHKFIIAGCECWLTERTGKAIVAKMEAERKAERDEREAWETVKRARETAERTNHPDDWSFYSDVYKDYFGVRPRH